MGAKSPEKSDGVDFLIEIAQLDSGRQGAFKRIFTHSQKSHQWTRHIIDLSKWAGKKVVLKFISDCGKKDNSTTDHSYWGDVTLFPAGLATKRSQQAKYMTWTNEKEFVSGFYFSDITSEAVDLEFTVESTEHFWITDISAHGSPDIIYRSFERGVVLANPSPRPYRFDLNKLFPGRKFRRFQATAKQDTKVNDGSSVPAEFTLAPKDAAFLVDY
jgi:hypothetical protein